MLSEAASWFGSGSGTEAESVSVAEANSVSASISGSLSDSVSISGTGAGAGVMSSMDATSSVVIRLPFALGDLTSIKSDICKSMSGRVASVRCTRNNASSRSDNSTIRDSLLSPNMLCGFCVASSANEKRFA